MVRSWIYLLFLMFADCQPAEKQPIVRVIRVADGDTFTILDGLNRQVKIRLHGIDAPEKGQDFFRVSRDYLGSLVRSGKLRYETVGKDKYGRTLAHVFVNDTLYVNLQMVAAGMAWHFRRFSSSPELEAAERKAREEGIGLWQLSHPEPPWEFRKK